MKRKFVSIILVLCIMIPLCPTVSAAAGHTYYSQHGNNTGQDEKLCYLTCVAMIVSDLGHSVTPADVYRANGNTAYTYWDTLQRAYGITVQRTELSENTNSAKETIIKLLNSGKYPQGIFLNITYPYTNENGERKMGDHAVVARKVVNGVIYCDDPGKRTDGCCISLEKCSHYSDSGARIDVYRTITKSSSWPGTGGSSTDEKQKTLTAKSTTSGDYYVTIPANYKLLCYSSSTATSASTYISAKSEPYKLSCTKQAVLSNGKTRYFFVSGNNKSLWFDFTSSMSVIPKNNTKTYTITFMDTGVAWKTMQTDASGRLASIPAPTREGHVFNGWYKTIGGAQLVTSDTVFTEDTKVLASWAGIFTVTFNVNAADGNVSPSSKTVTAGSSYGTLPTPTRNGYTFDGWYTSANGGTQVTASSSVGLSSVTLYAHWTEIPAENVSATTYTVTFDPKGGSVDRTTKQVAAGSLIGSMPVPTRAGYTFNGWCTVDEGSGLIVKEDNFIVRQDQTLYAIWEQISDQSSTNKKEGWGDWSVWSTSKVTASSTRQVETRQVQVSAGHTEYRYGRYVDRTGKHDCWCAKYLESLSYISGSATLQYSSWSTTRYSAKSGEMWTCGYCSGNHIGVDHIDSAGRPRWAEYVLSNGSYYWEESRWVDAVYETQYRYRDWILG